MDFPASFRGNFSPPSRCSSCCDLRFVPILASSFPSRQHKCSRQSRFSGRVLRLRFRRRRGFVCRVTDTETEPDWNNDKGEEHGDGELPHSTDFPAENDSPQPMDKEQSVQKSISNLDKIVGNINGETMAQEEVQAKEQSVQKSISNLDKIVGNIHGESMAQEEVQNVKLDAENVEVASGSPLPGLKSQPLDDSIMIPKETIEILKSQIFGLDTFFVTSEEPYEVGILFKGNLRGTAAESYGKITKRMQDRFGDQYKLFLLINPEDDKPVAVVIPRKTLLPDTTAVPEWFAAGAFGLVTVFTLLLHNVPALQSNLLSTFDNLELLKEGLAGAIITALVLGVHELSHILVAKSTGIKLGVPYFIPSWQIGSFGAITRIINIVPKREDLLKVAAAGPLAGFSLGLVLLLLGFVLPPSDGIGIVVNASVFHESFLAGGIAKLLLGDILKEGAPISINPLVIWALDGLLINAINCIPAGELDGGRISFAIWGRKASARFTAASIVLLGLSSLFSDVSFYWVVLIFFLQRGPIPPLSEEITDPDKNYVALGVVVLLLGLLICLPYPFPFATEAITTF